jgi:serine/threonine protein kinase
VSLIQGTKLGPYEILSPAGAGGMGEVYRARDTRLDRTVAIKVLPEHLSSSIALKQRFAREARAISKLQHPHICVLHDVGSENGTGYIVMEYLEGETLAQRLRKGPLPIEQLLKIGIEIADALDKAHRSGIIHRDLKPANIMLTKCGAKLMDFGLARGVAGVAASAAGGMPTFTAAATASDPVSPLTGEGAVIGTLNYMSPEQVEGKEADARSDIFAFGCVLYEMATGNRAFEGKSHISVASAILEKEPQSLSIVKPTSPPHLDALIRRCLEKNPEERYACAHDVKIQLQLKAYPQAARSSRGSGWKIFATAAALLVAVVIGRYAGTSRAAKDAIPGPAVRATIVSPQNTTFVTTGLQGGPPALSPDGEKLAFVARSQEGQTLIWVRFLNALNSRPLAGTDDASFPFWSPDSRHLGFFSRGKLKKIDIQAGPPEILGTVDVGRGGAWAPDGTILFAPGQSEVLWKVSAQGGNAERVTKFDQERQDTSHRWPQFLRDGKHFIFTVRAAGGNGTYWASLDDPNPKLLLAANESAFYAAPGYLLFVRGGTLFAQAFDSKRLAVAGEPQALAEHVRPLEAFTRSVFSASERGEIVYQPGEQNSAGSTLGWVDPAGKPIRSIAANESIGWPALSPEGRRLALMINDNTTASPDIWVIDLSRETRTRLTFSACVDPIWSPDGSRVFFSSLRIGAGGIFEKRADGTGQEQPLFNGDPSDLPFSWSPDGRFLAFRRVEKGISNIWIWPNFGDRKPYPFLQDRFNKNLAQISPDGKWLAYQSDESEHSEIYVVPFPSGQGRWQISSNGGRQPRWRRDGKVLFFIGSGDKIMAAEVRESGSSLEIGKPRAIITIQTPAIRGFVYDVSGDGKRFLTIQPNEKTTDEHDKTTDEQLVLIQNWPAELKK